MKSLIRLLLVISNLITSAHLSAQSGNPPPLTIIDPIVATDAGFVAFTSSAIQFSADGRSFVKTASDANSPFAAVSVLGGVVAASQNGLLHTNTRGEFSRPYFHAEQIGGLAGDGRSAVATEWYSGAHVWDGGREWTRYLVAEGAKLSAIAHAFSQYWIAGSIFLEDDESTCALWSSPDGKTWEQLTLPAFPNRPDRNSPPSLFVHIAATLDCVIAVDPFGDALVSRDGKTWKWTRVPNGPASDSERYYAEGKQLIRESVKDGKVVASIASNDGLKWTPHVRPSGWFAARIILGGRTPHYQVMTEANAPAMIVPEAHYRDPVQFAAEEKKAGQKKLQTVVGKLADLSGVFHGTANGIHWNGNELLVSADGGIYRSSDGAKFELWIPYERIAFQGLAKVGDRLWTWSGSPFEGKSELSGFPPNAGGKLPGYQTAVGRISGIAGEGRKLAFVTDAGNGCYVYSSDDGGDRWSFSPVKIGNLLPMQYGDLPNKVGPGLAYGNGRWVAVGRHADNTTVAAVSTDRVNWKAFPIGGPKGGMMRVVFANGRFVASGQKDFASNTAWTIASSTDGETWQLATLPGENPGLVDVAGGRLYAHNRTGVFYSEDAHTWRRISTHAPLDAITLEEIGGRIVLVGMPVSEGRANAPQYQLVQVPIPTAAEIATIPDVATQQVLAAIEKFDAAIIATTGPADMGKPLGEFITALDRIAPGPIADAIAEVAAKDMPAFGGVHGTFDLIMGLPDKRVGALNRKLSDDQRKMIQIFAIAHNARLYNQPVDKLAVGASEATWPPGTYEQGLRGPKTSDEMNLKRVRLAAFTGSRGAIHDLALIYQHGAGAPKDGVLGGFWARVYRQLDPAMPPYSAGEAAVSAHLAANGSLFFLALTGVQELDANQGRLTDALLEKLERAARGGMMIAQEELDKHRDAIRQRREGGLSFVQIYSAKSAPRETSAAAWIKAAGDAYTAAANDSGVSDEEMGLGPEALARTHAELRAMGMSDADIDTIPKLSSKHQAAEVETIVKALEKFDGESFYGILSYEEWGDVLGELVTALDATPNRPLADAVFKTACRFAEDFGGANGFTRFHSKIPPVRQSAALAGLSAARRAFVQKAGAAPSDWKPVEWHEQNGRISNNVFDPKKLHIALARGRHGAAFDLSSGLIFGDHETLNKFWFAVAETLVPGVGADRSSAAVRELIAAAGGAEAMAEQASELAQKRGPNDPQALKLLKEAADNGYKLAELTLKTRERNLADAAKAAEAAALTGTTFKVKTRAPSKRTGVELLELDGFTGDLKAVRRIDGSYYAISDKGVVLRSSDARNWTQIFAADGGAYDDITGGDGRLLLVPYKISWISIGAMKHTWATFDAGRTWQKITNDQREIPTYAIGKFWRYGAWQEKGATVGGFQSSADLKSWQNHSGIPAELLAKAPHFRMGAHQLFNARVYRHWGGTGGPNVESSTDFREWRTEFSFEEIADVTKRRNAQEWAVVGGKLVLPTMVALGNGKADYRILEPGQPWRTVTDDRTYLWALAHADGWTLAYDGSPYAGGTVAATRDFSRFRTIGDISGHSPRQAAGPEGFVFVGNKGQLTVLQPQQWWDLRPASQCLADAEAAQKRGDYAVMDAFIAEARKDEPYSEKSYAIEGRAGLERNQAARARAAIDEGLKQHPTSLELLGIRAFMRASTRDMAGAKADVDAVLAAYRWHPEAALTRFIITAGQDRSYLDAVLLSRADFAIGFTMRAGMRNMKGDRAGALEDLRAAEKSRPEHADFQRSLAGVYQQFGAAEDAKRCLETATKAAQRKPAP